MKLRITFAIIIISASVMFLLWVGCDSSEKPKKISLKDVITEAELNGHARENGEDVLWFGFDLRSSPQEDARQYLPFLQYLSNATGYHFELFFIPRGESIVDSLGSGGIQFAAVGAGTYIQAREKYGVVPLVRGVNSLGKAEYWSVIIVKPHSPIRKIADLRNKRFAFGDVTSTQGYLIPRIALAQNGIRLSDLRTYSYTGSHRNCANAVLSGRSDACGLQDTMGMALAKKGLVRIIFTSEYYPSSGIAANKNIPPQMLVKVRKALIDFDPEGSHAAGLYHWDKTEMPKGFTPAEDGDYAELRAWAKRLGYFSEIKGGQTP
ncbi:MAG: phosphate/phosphite/phosphonate ABC transporter substrate-binding protein [bacterium]